MNLSPLGSNQQSTVNSQQSTVNSQLSSPGGEKFFIETAFCPLPFAIL
ncbi:MAG: hypothetical protein F6K41_17900 [Symploca sp. SIO3E6]|nr:hypothetical protein [Caldora sp. SIO3E6]